MRYDVGALAHGILGLPMTYLLDEMQEEVRSCSAALPDQADDMEIKTNDEVPHQKACLLVQSLFWPHL